MNTAQSYQDHLHAIPSHVGPTAVSLSPVALANADPPGQLEFDPRQKSSQNTAKLALREAGARKTTFVCSRAQTDLFFVALNRTVDCRIEVISKKVETALNCMGHSVFLQLLSFHELQKAATTEGLLQAWD